MVGRPIQGDTYTKSLHTPETSSRFQVLLPIHKELMLVTTMMKSKADANTVKTENLNNYQYAS